MFAHAGLLGILLGKAASIAKGCAFQRIILKTYRGIDIWIQRNVNLACTGSFLRIEKETPFQLTFENSPMWNNFILILICNFYVQYFGWLLKVGYQPAFILRPSKFVWARGVQNSFAFWHLPEKATRLSGRFEKSLPLPSRVQRELPGAQLSCVKHIMNGPQVKQTYGSVQCVHLEKRASSLLNSRISVGWLLSWQIQDL